MSDMDEGARRWLLKTVRMNYWRVAHWQDPDDLVQDGYLHYHRIRTKYIEAKTPAQIMALFKVAFTNHLHDISKRRRKQVDVPLWDCVRDWGKYDSFVEARSKPFFDPSIILHAPEHVKKALCALLSDRSIELFRQSSFVSATHRMTVNERLCAIAGLDPARYNLVRDLKKFLSE
jgi:DNA-directed RNA polymerase specialized sigma24 family protein